MQLFDRVGRHIELNQNGEIYARYVEQSLRMLENGEVHLRRNKYLVSGTVSILCRTFGPILGDCIIEYRKLNPDVIFQVCHGESYVENKDFIFHSFSEDFPRADRNQSWISETLFTEPEEKGWTRSIAMLHKSDSLMTETALDFLEFCRDYFRERR